jgi:LCP family protein required for cell wall assembly
VVASVAVVVAVAGAAALSGLLAVRHLEGNIHRIPNVFTGLAAASRPVMPAVSRHSITILLTGSPTLPARRGGGGVDHSSTHPQEASGLIALVHLNASGKAGAIVSLPPDALVPVAGHGRQQLGNLLRIGGPSLLIGTVQRLTRVRIDHYTVVDFGSLMAVLGPLGGVTVRLPGQSVSDGVTFHAGTNHLTGATALDYVGQASLSEEGRVLRQQALLRAVLAKLAAAHLLSHPASAFGVLNAFTKALSVDSDFSNSQLRSLATRLRLLGAGSGTFITAPVRHTSAGVTLSGPVSRQLWTAIRNDDVAAFARRYPAALTPAAPH